MAKNFSEMNKQEVNLISRFQRYGRYEPVKKHRLEITQAHYFMCNAIIL